MRLFARVLLLEGHDEVAAEAAAAYERLHAKLGAPGADEEEGGSSTRSEGRTSAVSQTAGK